MAQQEVGGRRWDLWGAAAGFAIGAVDFATFRLLDVQMLWGGHDVLVVVVAVFALTFSALGFLNGRLILARGRARADADTIAAQLGALEDSQRDLVQAEKLAAIGRLAAGVAHEVRNPLGVIRASASMIQEDFEVESDGWRANQFIVEEIDRLDAMITALLKFARPDRLDVQQVALAEAVSRAVVLARPELEGRAIDLQEELAAALPDIEADPTLLSQLVYGLMINAAEMLEREGRIRIRAALAGDALEIDVADSGPGVPPESSEAIFEPFFTTKAHGTGLGLPIAARIAQAHGGSLSAVQGQGLGPGGQGACFRLRLPLEHRMEAPR